MAKELVNKVALSGLINFNLEEFYPKEEFHTLDLKDFLFMELILKEKDFREAMKSYEWSSVNGKILLIVCSADAIIPSWAYMLISSYAAPVAHDIFEGSKEEYLKAHYYQVINTLDIAPFQDKRIVIKGCSNQPVPVLAYTKLTQRLHSVAKSIMFGEPCSTVPIYKKPKI